jgi:hypothetical protein
MAIPRLRSEFEQPIGRKRYAAIGFSLMALKYGLDAGAVYAVAGSLWTPLDYLSPFLDARAKGLDEQSWVLWLIALWSLPFMGIALALTCGAASTRVARHGSRCSCWSRESTTR